MIIHDFEQGSSEWYEARIGVITASNFGKIITPKTGKISSQSDEVENRIVAELLTHEEEESFAGNAATERGKELEPEAVSMYEILRECKTTKCGFITNDERTVGCSPDRLVGEDGLLEIKSPYAHTHVGYLLSEGVADEYKAQTQGQLMVSGRKWIDVFSYHPKIPPSIIRVERDEDFIAKLDAALTQSLSNIQIKLKKIKGE